MGKDRATEYWNTEIRRAATDTAKAYAEYQHAKEEEERAHNRQITAKVNDTDAEAIEEAQEIHRRKSLITSQKWESYLMASKWEGITRGAAESYKKRKAANK